jgi:hypothetical protein
VKALRATFMLRDCWPYQSSAPRRDYVLRTGTKLARVQRDWCSRRFTRTECCPVSNLMPRTWQHVAFDFEIYFSFIFPDAFCGPRQ